MKVSRAERFQFPSISSSYVKGDRMDDDNVRTIRGTFATREAADLAIEHLVQEHGIDRADIFVQAKDAANTSGIAPSGADAPGDDESSDLDPALRGEIEVSADVSRDESQRRSRPFARPAPHI